MNMIRRRPVTLADRHLAAAGKIRELIGVTE